MSVERVRPGAGRGRLHLDVVPAARLRAVRELLRPAPAATDCAARELRLRLAACDVRRAGPPEDEADVGAGPVRRQRRLQLLSRPERDLVDVDRVVLVVERRGHRIVLPHSCHGLRAGVVVRLVLVRRRQRSLERRDRARDVEPSPAAEPVAPDRALRAAGRRRSRRRRSARGWPRPGRAVSVGSTAKSSAAAAETCGAANDVPSALKYSGPPQSE